MWKHIEMNVQVCDLPTGRQAQQLMPTVLLPISQKLPETPAIAYICHR